VAAAAAAAEGSVPGTGRLWRECVRPLRAGRRRGARSGPEGAGGLGVAPWRRRDLK